MNPYELMELKQGSFTKTDQHIVELINKNADAIFRNATVTNLAKEYGISQASLTRFIQKLGYPSYNEFKFDIYRCEKQSLTNEDSQETILEAYSNLILMMQNVLKEEELITIAQEIAYARTVVSIGMHKSFLPAQSFQYNMLKLAKPSVAFSSDDRHEVKHFITKEDIIILFTAEGESAKDFINEYKEKDIPIILITMNEKTTIRKYAKHMIWLPNSRNQNMHKYLENQVFFLVFVDLLTSYVAKELEKGEKNDDLNQLRNVTG